jgi:ParB-like chromosome segregation protein Spo0J
MLEKERFSIDAIYVPTKRKKEIDSARVDSLAEDIMENGQKVPIRVRRDGDRLVLVEGLHRLEACRALGEQEITGYLTHAALK